MDIEPVCRINVLDHGYVEFIEPWGHGKGNSETLNPGQWDYEVGIIEAARQSTQGSFRGWEKDRKLLEYLYENKHSTPFEFAGMVLEIQAPIFVFREWQRHRTQSYSEMSARYAPLPEVYYVPTLERVMMGAGEKNKQAAAATGAQPLTEEAAKTWIAELSELEGMYHRADRFYNTALSYGIPKELARTIMPVGHYSRMRACTNLRNWLMFLTLRMDPAAQWEIQQFACAVYEIIKFTFPETARLFAQDFV